MTAVKSDVESEVREIIESRLDRLQGWLDKRLRQQEQLLKSFINNKDCEEALRTPSRSSIVACRGEPEEGNSPPHIWGVAGSLEGRSPPSCSGTLEFEEDPDALGGTVDPEETPATPGERTDVNKTKSFNSDKYEDQLWLTNLMELFDQLDLDRTGSIDFSEFHEAFKEVGMEDKMDAIAVFRSLDTSCNGVIDRVEWLQVISDSARADDREALLVHEFLDKIEKLRRNRGSLYDTDRSRKLVCMIRHDSILRMAWDIAMVVLLFYVSLSVPYMLGFGESNLLNLFDRISDMIFCCDVMLNFRTTFLDKDETLVISGKRIAIRYLKSWFAIDFFSSIPLDLITAGMLPDLTAARLVKIGKIAKVLKMLRLTKVVMILQEAEWADLLDHYLSSGSFEKCYRMVKLASVALFVAHWLACFGSAVDSESISEYFSNNFDTDTPNRFQEYVAAVYWSMSTLTTVGYGDITPKSDAGRAYTVAAMLLGGSLYGYVIGSITSIVADMDVQAHSYYERMSRIQSWLDIHEYIPLILRRRLRKHFKKAFATKSVIDDGAVVDQLSPELRGEVASFLIHLHVRRHQMFSDLPNSALAELVHVLQVTHATVHECVVKTGDPGIGMYILVHGLARYDEGVKWQAASAHQQCRRSQRFQHVVEGDGFGEEIIFGFAETYTYTIVTIIDSEFHWISKDGYREHYQNMPELQQQMYHAILAPKMNSPNRSGTNDLSNFQSENVDSDEKCADQDRQSLMLPHSYTHGDSSTAVPDTSKELLPSDNVIIAL